MSEQSLKITDLCKEVDTLKAEFENKLDSDLRYKAFMLFLKNIVTAKKISLTEKHNKKLAELNGGPIFF